MVNHAIIVHGWGADSTSNWFPWLADELKKRNWNVLVPNFPKTQNPILGEWLKYYESIVAGLAPAQTVLISHSLGVPFILRMLEKTTDRYVAAYLVSGFERSLGIPETENFVDTPFDWDAIRSHCKKFMVINSDNDPFIPLDVGEALAKSLKAELIVEHNGEHLNAPAGYLEYPKLLGLTLSHAK